MSIRNLSHLIGKVVTSATGSAMHVWPLTFHVKDEFDRFPIFSKITHTHSTDYLPHELSKHMLPAKLPYIPPTQSMQSKSMYTQDYPVYNDAAPAVPVRRSEQTKLGGKFDAMPTYTSEFFTTALLCNSCVFTLAE